MLLLWVKHFLCSHSGHSPGEQRNLVTWEQEAQEVGLGKYGNLKWPGEWLPPVPGGDRKPASDSGVSAQFHSCVQPECRVCRAPLMDGGVRWQDGHPISFVVSTHYVETVYTAFHINRKMTSCMPDTELWRFWFPFRMRFDLVPIHSVLLKTVHCPDTPPPILKV